MAVNIGPKIGVDGEAEYRAQINNIIQQGRTLESQMKRLEAGFDGTTSAQEKAAAAADILSERIKVQRQRVSALEDMLDKSANALGENDTKTLKWQQAVNEANAELSRMERELQEAENQLKDTGDALDDVGDEADDAGDKFVSFTDILNANFLADAALDVLREVGEALKDFAVESLEAASDVKASGSKFKQTFGDMEKTARKSLESISDETKITSTRLQDAFTDIYAFSKNVGVEAADALDISSRAMIVAADNAAYYDKSVEDATESLQSFLKGNYENDAALGIAATETTRNAKANEMYAMSFDKLSEAQKVDVLLAMVEAGNAASGALGSAAREADEWTNVTGEATEAIRQLQAVIGDPVLEALTPIIKNVTEAIYEMIETSDADKLIDNLEDIEDAFKDAESQLADSRKEIESNAFVAEHYAERLKTLEEAGLDTAESQREYANVVSALNELMPELNLLIDEQTGLTNMSNAVIMAEIEAMKQKAMYMAYEERYTAALRAHADAQLVMKDAEYSLVEIEGQRKLLLEQLESSTGRSAEEVMNLYHSQQMYNSELLETNDTVPVAMQELASATSVTKALTEEEKAAVKEIEALNQEESRLKRVISDANKTMAEQDGILEETNEAMGDYTSGTNDAADAETQMEIAAESLIAELEALRAEYEEARESARKSIDSQIGYFQELENQSSMSAAEMIANWDSQKVAFENYADNLQKAVDMGLDEALVQQLSDGSEQSMAILEEFVNSTDVSVDEINDAFSGLSEARDTAATAMTDARSDVADVYSGMIADAKAAGVQIPAGLALGVRSNIGSFTGAMSSLGSLGTKSFNNTMRIRSPSRVMYDAGIYTTEGAVNAVDDSINLFEASMEKLAMSGRNAFVENIQIPDVVYMDPEASIIRGGNTNNNYSYGGISITIDQQPGEDPEELAYRVLEIAQTEIMKKEASLRGQWIQVRRSFYR